MTAIEGCVRAAQHVMSSEGLGVPDSNAAAVRDLGAREIIDPDLSGRVARAVGFRNVLVHEYAEVDNALVVAHLGLLDDLEAYVAQLGAWGAARS